MNDHLLWLLLSGLLSAAVSALWNFVSKRSLQRDKAETKIALATLENQFQKAERRAQAEIDRSVFVTRAQFEAEFESMKEVFSLLSQVYFAIQDLWPTTPYESRGEEESKRTRMFQRIEGMMRSHNELRTALEAKRPFYPEDLYETVTECLDAAQMEAYGIRRVDPATVYDKYFREPSPTRTRFLEGYSGAANIIRDRIATLAILPRS